jgi:ketosteroid isomerase-like protein
MGSQARSPQLRQSKQPNHHPQKETPMTDSLQSAILDINARWNSAFNSGDAAQVSALYNAEAAIAPAGGAQVTGTDAIRNFWQGLIDQGVGGHAIDCIEVGSSGDLAYQRGRWSASAMAASSISAATCSWSTACSPTETGRRWCIAGTERRLLQPPLRKPNLEPENRSSFRRRCRPAAACGDLGL